MCTCYAEMDVLFGHKPNATPIVSYDSQEKDSLNGDDDDVFLGKQNNGLESPLNLDPLINNDDDLVKVENLQDQSSGSRKRPMDMFAPTYANLLDLQQKACKNSGNSCLEWDRERWNEEKVSNMEKQQFEELKLQKKREFEEKQHTKKYEFEKEKRNHELEFKEKKCQMDLTIAALSSSRPILELEHILTSINTK
ncbi:hypothetical protein O181_092540 [Austropuccinia psidii MF-1]|uniref:No apical meristem-associated C-terminal domain-containing protein n=1 Tax=Austropuccinia psidii MF-1 TaxID=1389203 RepID=A0A9Q3IYS5_9BASI|nr:hypothetical protein [Austropuccinia psidii MF-1]